MIVDLPLHFETSNSRSSEICLYLPPARSQSYTLLHSYLVKGPNINCTSVLGSSHLLRRRQGAPSSSGLKQWISNPATFTVLLIIKFLRRDTLPFSLKKTSYPCLNVHKRPIE